MPAEPIREQAAAWLGPLGDLERSRLENGLEVCLLPSTQAPIVVVSIWYRVGCRDEAGDQGGLAHFLEHMMFKGSAAFPMGEIDRLTQALGGENNAFTSHDATAYHFAFATEHWQRALEIEADRMNALLLDPDEIEKERQVILEEISMYEDDPWDSLELETTRRFYDGHPYGRSILGQRESVEAIDREALEAFHRRYYRPDNAVLVIAGDLGRDPLRAVERCFARAHGGGEARTAAPVSFEPPDRLSRLRRSHGKTPRLLMALPAPAAEHPDYAPWRLLVNVLGGARSSRLYRMLVDEGELCSSMSAESTEMAGPGVTLVSAEVLPGVNPDDVEAEVKRGLVELRSRPPSDRELERARRLVLADWVFALERVHHQAMVVGQAEAALSSGYPAEHLRALLGCDRERLIEVAERCLPLDADELGGIVGWSFSDRSPSDGEGDR